MEVDWLSSLNSQQRAAAAFGPGPLLIIAGAGTGKTNTLAHRVAHLLATGINPGRLLLLTFTRRAAAQMSRRVEALLGGTGGNKWGTSASAPQIWSGTFHSVANRLLRIYSQPLGLGEMFTIIDRSDAEDLLNDVRGELGLDKGSVRFPRKATALSIYSRCVNAREPLESAVAGHFPWCRGFEEDLKRLFKGYVERKQRENVLDYDDLLLYWYYLMQEESLAGEVSRRFDAVLVDEYQDTNALQAQILQRLCPEGHGLTVVGDDAQSIYSFRAATVHNILEFPQTFSAATVLTLEQNYRSVQPILDATNAVIALCPHRYNKDLYSSRASQQKPRLVTLADEEQQSDYVIGRCLEHLEAGIPLHKQAVLFRAAHHSDALEVELSRRNIPFVKYGGLKFLEAAHVKDLLAILRLAENPRDSVSTLRVLQLMDGFGPAHARRAIAHLFSSKGDLSSWESFAPPAAASEQWPRFVSMMLRLAPDSMPLAEQIAQVRIFYAPILEKRYDHAHVRARDLEQLEEITGHFRSRANLLADLTLDPPTGTQDLAGPPLREEDFLILSTIHSAKGCEWDVVYVIHAADGNIPSDMATGSAADVEEERRLFYVALTRARDFVDVCFPLRYYQKKRSERYSFAQLTRFLPETVLDHFERVSLPPVTSIDPTADAATGPAIRQKIASMWE